MRILSADTGAKRSSITRDISWANKLQGSSSSPVYRRDHLHKLLDELSTTPLIVLNAWSGSGKTTFMADYAARHPFTCIWYRASRGDDIGSVLFGLAASASESHLLHNQHELFWALDEIDATDSSAVRQFFATLSRQITAPFLIVIDNFQEVRSEDTVDDVLRAACQGLPPAGHIVIVNSGICRLNLTDMRRSFPVAVLENQDFELSVNEVSEMATLYDRPLTSPVEARRLWASVEGCVSCLVGMLMTSSL